MFGARQIFAQHSIYSDFYCPVKIYVSDSHEYSEDCLARKRQAVGPFTKLLKLQHGVIRVTKSLLIFQKFAHSRKHFEGPFAEKSNRLVA